MRHKPWWVVVLAAFYLVFSLPLQAWPPALSTTAGRTDALKKTRARVEAHSAILPLSAYPVFSGHLLEVKQIAVGETGACAILNDGSLKCWGIIGIGGELSDFGNKATAYGPIPVGVKQLSLGFDHACALLEGGSVKCWGNNDTGQLGDGTKKSSALPVNVIELEAVKQLATGTFTIDVPLSAEDDTDGSTCAVLDDEDASVKCWGFYLFGSSLKPVFAGEIKGAKQISKGLMNTCILFEGGSVKCSGFFPGDGRTSSAAFVPVSGLTSGVTQIAVALDHSCALLVDGSVKCWGADYASTPVFVSELTNVKQITANTDQTCALLKDGSVKCWGKGGIGESSLTPMSIGGLSGVTQVEAGVNYACALLIDGSVKCWGKNDHGQLGSGKEEDSSTPVFVMDSGMSLKK